MPALNQTESNILKDVIIEGMDALNRDKNTFLKLLPSDVSTPFLADQLNGRISVCEKFLTLLESTVVVDESFMKSITNSEYFVLVNVIEKQQHRFNDFFQSVSFIGSDFSQEQMKSVLTPIQNKIFDVGSAKESFFTLYNEIYWP